MATEFSGFKDVASGFNETSYTTDTGISSGVTYLYRVRAENSVGFGNYSDVLEILAAVAPVDPPTELTRDE